MGTLSPTFPSLKSFWHCFHCYVYFVVFLSFWVCRMLSTSSTFYYSQWNLLEHLYLPGFKNLCYVISLHGKCGLQYPYVYNGFKRCLSLQQFSRCSLVTFLLICLSLPCAPMETVTILVTSYRATSIQSSFGLCKCFFFSPLLLPSQYSSWPTDFVSHCTYETIFLLKM